VVVILLLGYFGPKVVFFRMGLFIIFLTFCPLVMVRMLVLIGVDDVYGLVAALYDEIVV